MLEGGLSRAPPFCFDDGQWTDKAFLSFVPNLMHFQGGKLFGIRSFKVGLALACGLPLAVALSVFIYFSWQNEQERQCQLLVEKADVIAEKILNRLDLADSVILQGHTHLTANSILDEIVQSQEVFSYISLLDPFGRVVYHSSNPLSSTVLSDDNRGEVYEIIKPRYFQSMQEVFIPLRTSTDQTFGLVRIGVREDFFQHQLYDFALRMGVPGLLSVILTVIFSVLFASRFFGRSLAPLINSVDRVTTGDFTRRVDSIYVREELIPLSSSLNRLFESIETDKKRIHRIRSGLTEYERILDSTKTESIEKVQQLLRRSDELEERFQILMQMTWQGIAVFDSNGEVVVSNAPLRRMIRLERQGRQLFIPEQVQQMVSRLFASSASERAEGSFDLEDEVFLKQCRCRFRCHRLKAPGSREPRILLILEDSTHFDQIEKERAEMGELFTRTVLPVIDLLEEDLQQAQVEGLVDEKVRSTLTAQAEQKISYILAIMRDWSYWDRKFRLGENPPVKPVNITKIVRGLPSKKLGGFSEKVHIHLPEQSQQVNGCEEELSKMLEEYYILLQLAVPGEQDCAIDVMIEPDILCLCFRKSAARDQDWSPPAWLDKLEGDRPLSQNTWINLKLSIVRLLANYYGIRIRSEVSTAPKPGLALSLEIPFKQAKRAQNREVNDLIKRFFVASV